MFVDSHCHLNFPDYADKLDQVRAEMAQAQVDRALCISTTLEEFPQVHALATRFDNFWATVGVHPDNEEVQEPTVADLVERATLPRVVGIGETGLDYFRLGERSVADMHWQRERFRVHIQAGLDTSLPLIIHTRQASDDTIAILTESGQHQSRGVFHCFTESQAVARAALDLGFYISFSGILTFKTAADLREVAKFVPLDRCLIETDSPYLAPMPHRGKTNSPANVALVGRFLAELKGVEPEELGRITTRNFEQLFAIPPLTAALN
ncbi:TatD family hydrolase [Aquabacterium sp.]|uniref:TatD family hydrolase n=1 Tax=Aquabacterium sp. TaxID=1872578 RepID=UPI0019BF472B|nr:TatD family hydrolase [Aquabacterium sp.]MBC7700099.1 TatD family hydrolase [Aquabacterium sp.]